MPQPALTLLTLLFLSVAAQAAAGPGRAVEVLSQQTLSSINAVRSEHALPALQPDPALSALALTHSRQMAQSGLLSHRELDGRTFAERMQASGLSFRLAAENIAMNSGQADPAAAAVAGWMESKGHRANILTASFSRSGVGVWVVEGRYYFTQIFLQP